MFLILLLFCSEGICMNNDITIKISGEHAKAIQIACYEFHKKLDINWKDYEVSVHDKINHIIVVFKYKTLKQGFRGAEKNIPGFEVELKHDTFEIINSHFIR
jgi:hypothetical protein